MDYLLSAMTAFAAVWISGLVIYDSQREEQIEEQYNKLNEELDKLKEQIKRKKEREYRDKVDRLLNSHKALDLEIEERSAQLKHTLERFNIVMSLPAHTSIESSSAPQDP